MKALTTCTTDTFIDQVVECDAMTLLRSLPSDSVHCMITSPPYFGLRDYNANEQIGREPSPEHYIKNLVDIFAEAKRVLRKDGTFWLNLGDTYSGGHRASYENNDVHVPSTRPVMPFGLPGKNMLLIPSRVAIALQESGWILRNDIIWHKPSSTPESVTDRCTKSHEHIFFFVKSPRYYFDQDAIRTPLSASSMARAKSKAEFMRKHHVGSKGKPIDERLYSHAGLSLGRNGKVGFNILGSNKRDVWSVAHGAGYSGEHYATYPPKLIEPCVLAGSPQRVCEVCGAPYRRVTERTSMVVTPSKKSGGYGSRTTSNICGTVQEMPSVTMLGWEPTCECNAGTKPGIVLDMFGGSGTTGLVARQHGRSYIMCDVNGDYVKMARDRLRKPFEPRQYKKEEPGLEELPLFSVGVTHDTD